MEFDEENEIDAKVILQTLKSSDIKKFFKNNRGLPENLKLWLWSLGFSLMKLITSSL